MGDFPSFMKNQADRVDTAQQNTADVEGYVYQGTAGQMAFWTCHEARESKPHTHPFDEWTLIIEGEYTMCTAEGERVLRPGDEVVVPAGTTQWGRCTAGTRSVHAFGGQRVKRQKPAMIEHAAVWTYRLEEMKEFYVRWFGGVPNDMYKATRPSGAVFRSYFVNFGSGARLEIMQQDDVPNSGAQPCTGMSHIAFSVPGMAGVDDMVERFRAAGIEILSPARRTGDGYYEAVVADPDGNRVELVAV
jgi:catechol 2,3-dioxygenase-like lactoylglutathione lyase family enzyme/quercetin dioxygenase-like cupin family protein